jgi:hypothetical protein
VASSDSAPIAVAPPAEPAPDLARLKNYFSESQQLTQASRRNSLTAQDYYDSDQFTREELLVLEGRGQPAIVINRIKPAINGIIGVTERARSDPRCWPRTPNDTDSADAATDVLRFVADANRFKRTKQECFKDLLVPGSMAALIGIDEDLQVTITQVRWEEFFYDGRSRRPDFKDARFLGVAKWMYADDATSLYPERSAEIATAVENSPGGGIMPDQSYQDRPLAGPGTGGAWNDPKQRRLLVVEVYYRDNGWKRAVYTGSDVLEHGPSPYLDHRGRPDCPIEAMSAYVKRDNSRYGAVWDMIGPQDEVNKRRSKSVHEISVSRIEMNDPMAADEDVDKARREAARPDGVLPRGYVLSPNTANFQGNMEMMAEAKSELERMGPSPAVLGRTDHDSSGRALLARQQSGLVELANLYGALEDWELRVYRQCWGRVKQYWTAPQFIRVTDDENSPRFVGLNQPIPGGPPTMGTDPQTGAPTAQPGVLGYKNIVAEMDVDIEVDTEQDIGNIAAEQFSQIIDLVKLSPIYQQQAPLPLLIQLSTMPHKRSLLDQIKQAADQQAQKQAQAEQLAQAHAQADLEVKASVAQKNAQMGTASVMNALSESHAVHADHATSSFQAGLAQAQHEQAQAIAERQMQQAPPPGQQDADETQQAPAGGPPAGR